MLVVGNGGNGAIAVMQNEPASQGVNFESSPRGAPGRTLLLVDDEPRVSRGLQRVLRRDGYTIHIASGSSEALNLLARCPVDVVLSDQRMPGMNGTEFLREVSVAYPDTVRMILSGAADVEEIAEAMGSGVIYKFLTKPIDPALLRANVIEAFTRSAASKIAHAPESILDREGGLPTRRGVEALFETLVDAERSSTRKVTVLVLRVDQYDGIVSSYGRSFSAQVLHEVTRRLASVLDREEVLGLDSPGTFLMALVSTDPDERVAKLDDEIERLLDAPVRVGERSLTVTLSIGASVDASRISFDELVDQAHTAMMTGKERGGATIQLFQPHLVEAFRGQLELESELRCAVADKAFELHFQPQVEISSGQIVGLEALVRWRHPELGLVSPVRFIPIAERSGLIEELGMWILASAVQQFTTWDRAGKAPRELAVNVSAAQLKRVEFAERVRHVLHRSGLPAERLVLEITESAAIEENDAISECLNALHALGVILAVDDFGTGYANLGNLTRFSFTQLKLDRSLLPRSPDDERAMRLYKRVCGLAEELRMTTIAEGVETANELAAVVASGCGVVQGYFYSRPIAVAQLDELLASRFTLEQT
jgi:diguanylate cyclase (GGDEF)-like protein